MIKPENQVLVGVIIAPHGIDGLVSVECLSDNPQRFAAGAVIDTSAGTKLTVIRSSMHKGRLLVSFAGIDSRDAAEKLRKIQLYISPAQAGPLPAGVYYHFQLAGLSVWEQERELGKISDILSYSANDVYVVEKPEGGQLLLPALKAIIKNIDLERGIMEVKLPEGLE